MVHPFVIASGNDPLRCLGLQAVSVVLTLSQILVEKWVRRTASAFFEPFT